MLAKASIHVFLFTILTACASPDAHAPPFVQHAYAPFSRTSAVAIATDEWRLWGMRVDDNWGKGYTQKAATMGERQPGLWQRVGEYWWEGVNANEPDNAWTGKHNGAGTEFPVAQNGQYAWSAAFISYVMRIAGAGKNFPYSPDHATYINYAARAAKGEIQNPLLIARNPATYAPRLGDLLCFGRGRARALTFADLPTAQSFPAHCAIVTSGKPGEITIISGNEDDAVELQHIPADPTGHVTAPWSVILQVNYTSNT